MEPADLLFGRKTFDIFAGYWPERADNWPGINDVTKYVMSRTVKKSDWKNSVFLNSLADIENLKNLPCLPDRQAAGRQGSKGSDIKVWGSGELTQFLSII